MRSVKYLKQVFVYLFAYFMLQESKSSIPERLTYLLAYGTYYGVVGILQNEWVPPRCHMTSSANSYSVIKYSPALLNGMNIVGSVAGGSGNLLVFLLQRKYRFATKVCFPFLPLRCLSSDPLVERSLLRSVHDPSPVSILVHHARGTLTGSNLWGAIGAGTNVIGFHKGEPSSSSLPSFPDDLLTYRMGVLDGAGLERESQSLREQGIHGLTVIVPNGRLVVLPNRFFGRTRPRPESLPLLCPL
jgi:hypothetical protein